MPSRPMFIAPARFDDPAQALAQVQDIYRNSIEHLRSSTLTPVLR
jgi:AMP nucleosidase